MRISNNKPLRFLFQVLNYGLFMALIWYFSSAPSITLIEENEAVITIAFAHAGDLREPCRMLSQEELDQLAPNMRKLDDCPRERSPVTIEALLDGEPFYQISLQPQGLYGDGGVDVFHSAKVEAGSHSLSIKMNDSVRVDRFNHNLDQQVSILPAQILLVSFDKKRGFMIESPQSQ